MVFADLYQNKLVTEVTKEAVKVQAALSDKRPIRVEPEYDRDPDEHEYYLLRLGKSIVEILTACEYLEIVPVLLGQYRETAALKKAGMNRSRYIVYNVENYVVRAQGLYDRILKLLDSVFHLLNDARNCREHVILKNLKVKHHEDVLEATKNLSKLLRKYASDRNEIIHEASFQNDQLRILELYCLAERFSATDNSFPKRDYKELIQESAAEIIYQKKIEFIDFNKQLGPQLYHLFELLYPCYLNEEHMLRRRLNK